MVMLRQFKNAVFVLLTTLCCAHTSVSAQEDIDSLDVLKQNIQKACPKQWEDLFKDIQLNPNVLDIWQGDLSDKAQFVQYANEFLLKDGVLLIDNYHDVVTIMAECGAQRVAYYKTIRQQTGESVSGLVNALTGQAAFGRNSIAGGVDYGNWVSGTTLQEDALQSVTLVNLAMGRNTTQTGTSSDELSDTETEYSEEEYGELAEAQGYAVKAVDNDTDGNFVNGSVTHTGTQDQPYWEVDLDEVSNISSIVIFNRTDCCESRLSNFTILLSNRPIDARALSDAKALPDVSYRYDSQSLSGPSKEFDFADGTRARYVRIQLGGNKTALSLAEVQIFGTPIEKDL